ncbi:L-seryl-tRNA(Sec) selenium transferase [bacterium]|nr:L-seryl-tRNA(Sec) selenium transferase [bacterium]
MNEEKHDRLKELPSIDGLIEQVKTLDIAKGFSHKHVVNVSRDVIESIRQKILDGKFVPKDLSAHAVKQVEKTIIELKTPSLARVVNLTGVFVHTNLGRSPLMQDAMDALKTAADYCNLEYDLSERKRGKRDRNLSRMLSLIAGCENFLLTNNNAAALFLVLNTLAKGKKVAVSRGELIEIGGSFRIPDIMRASGAKLVEVGTTNRTRLSDYKNAIDDGVQMILKVHTSNYSVEGFTESTPAKQLVELAKSKDVLCVEDLGSGTFVDFTKWNLPFEPTVQDSLNTGVDLVTFSVDKLLGGPQGGLVLGNRELIAKMNKNPIKRVVRAGKLTLLALEATLRGYLDEENIMRTHPLYRNLILKKDVLVKRGEKYVILLKEKFGDNVEYAIRNDKCYIGGGSLPGQAIDTMVVELNPVKIKLKKLADVFFENKPPIIGRIADNKLIFDLRQLENIKDGVPTRGL